VRLLRELESASEEMGLFLAAQVAGLEETLSVLVGLDQQPVELQSLSEVLDLDWEVLE